MSSEKDLRASFKTFIQDLPQLAAEKGLKQVYDLYKSNGYDSLTIGDSPQSQVDLLAEGMIHWHNNGFFRLAELYDGVQLEHNDDYLLALMNLKHPTAAGTATPRPATTRRTAVAAAHYRRHPRELAHEYR